jgi:hypothetical protein
MQVSSLLLLAKRLPSDNAKLNVRRLRRMEKYAKERDM